MAGESQLYSGGKPTSPKNLVSEFLTNGTTNDVIGNYATVERFKITCKQGSQQLHINRMMVSIEDAGNFDSAKYGNNITLTNGINVCVRDASDALVVNLTTDNIKTNADWASYCHDVALHNFGVGNQILTARWTFGKMGKLITLNAGEYLTIEANDDLSGLVRHRFLVQGHYGK